MSTNKSLIVLSLVLFFSLGFILGLNQKENVKENQRRDDEYVIPEKIQHQSSSELEVKNDSIISTEIGDDEKKSPDQEYYKKARVLQSQYPNTFIMEYQTQSKRIALTFDDGPDGKTTPKILDLLDEYDIPATFFVVGENVASHPTVVKRMIDEGHQVANHSWSHMRPTELTLEEFMSEINPTKEILQNYNSSSQFFYYRPPYGLLTPKQIEGIMKNGYKVISWSIDSLDWTISEPKEIRDKVITSAHPGAIVLMHSAGGKDGRLGTVKALPEIVETLTRQGYEFVTVHDLINGS